MDIKLFSEIVKELLRNHDKVTLPGFGCFVVEDAPASFSDKGFTINPPYRKVCFRPLRDPDTLLVDFYAMTNNADKVRARTIVNDFVKGLRDSVYSRKMILLPGFGKLRATKENNVFFIQDESLDLFPQFDFLESVSLKSMTGSPSKDCADNARNHPKVSVPEPLAVQKSVPVDIPVPPPSVETIVEPVVEARRREMPLWVKVMIAAVSVVVVALGTLALLGRVKPELVDPLLYSPEELEILNYII